MLRSKRSKAIAAGTVVLVVSAVAVALWAPWRDNVDSGGGMKPSSAEISILECGAVAGDGQDDYKAITACIAKAKTEGKSVFVPKGEFELSDILELDGVSLKGAGEDQTTLISTNPERGSIDLSGDGVTLSKFKHVYRDTVERGNGSDEKNSVTVKGATHFTIEHLVIDKASTAGILVRGASSNGTIANNKVEGTGADGIHLTDGSTHITVEQNEVRRTGDDTIAVVSYLKDKAPVSDIVIRQNNVGYGSEARGISVVGGNQVQLTDNQIQETQMAGIYISSEKEWETTDTEGIVVSGNTVERTGLRADSDHPNILVYASHGKVSDITFSANIVKNAAHDGIGVWGEGQIGRISFNSNKVSGSANSPTNFKEGDIDSKENEGF